MIHAVKVVDESMCLCTALGASPRRGKAEGWVTKVIMRGYDAYDCLGCCTVIVSIYVVCLCSLCSTGEDV